MGKTARERGGGGAVPPPTLSSPVLKLLLMWGDREGIVKCILKDI